MAKRRIHQGNGASYPSSSSSLSSVNKNKALHEQQQQQQKPQPPSLTRRVANSIFSPSGLAIAAAVGVPLALGAAYWLFVVNGPTPVVRARNQDKDHEESVFEAVLQALLNL